MGVRNYLIEGVSGAGKTAVATELQRRGYQVIHGDRELAYRGDPETGLPAAPEAGAPTVEWISEHYIWDVAKVRAYVADRTQPLTFFCGGSRNHAKFIDLFDGVFVLEVDVDTMNRRIDQRVARTRPTSGANHRNANSLRDCSRRKPMSRSRRRSSTPPPRSNASSTRFSGRSPTRQATPRRAEKLRRAKACRHGCAAGIAFRTRRARRTRRVRAFAFFVSFVSFVLKDGAYGAHPRSYLPALLLSPTWVPTPDGMGAWAA